LGDVATTSSQQLQNELLKWLQISPEEGIGCILEVDLEYPKELHNLHNDLPLAPERVVVNKVEKLIPTLSDKKNCVLQYSNLKQYLEMGLKLTKFHRGISFNEEAWFKPYIELNTQLRTKATNDFEKYFFKLMNNSVFGKTMENIRNRVDVRLRTSEKSAEKLVTKPNYERTTIFSEDLIAVHMKKTELVFNKPVYLGMAILDISKTRMYDFHYNYMKVKYGDDCKLLMTDTDSLMYEVKTKDFYKDIREDVQERFDTSNFPQNHSSGILRMNKKVPGKFKNDCDGEIISEFCRLRAKLYAFKKDGEEEK